MEREASKLRYFTDYGFHINLFEIDKGSFWGIVETRDYMTARLELANLIHDELAYDQETVELWEKVLMHYQEMLRLSSGDNLEPRATFSIPVYHSVSQSRR